MKVPTIVALILGAIIVCVLLQITGMGWSVHGTH